MRACFYLFAFLNIFHLPLFSQEICDNSIDDDGDGMVDLLDTTDCKCIGFGYVSNIPSLIPNTSFEVMSNCPNNYGQIEKAVGWIMASNANQTSYLNTCGYLYNSINQSGLLPFPDGEGIAAAFIQPGWTEYLASCLNQPLSIGQHYTIQLDISSNPILTNSGPLVDIYNNGLISYGQIEFSVFGTNNCNNLPFSGYGCPPSSTWSLLGSAIYTPSNSWSTISINFIPNSTITAIAIGAPCIIPNTYPDLTQPWCPVFYYDHILLNKTDYFSMIEVIQTGLPCSNNVELVATTDTSGGSWQWYKNGVALIGENSSILQVSQNNYGYGKFTARYFNGIDCGTFTYDLELPDPIELDFIADINLGCIPLEVTFRDTLNKEAVYCHWNFGDYETSSICNLVTHQFQQTGCFNVSLEVTTNDSCKTYKQYENLVCAREHPIASFLFSPNEISASNSIVNFENNSINASEYLWYFTSKDSVSIANPSFEFKNFNKDLYEVTLHVKNELGCTDSIIQQIKVRNELIVYIPNSFTPNGDGNNESFKPIFIDGFTPLDYSLTIYDRWGKIIFISNDYRHGWDETVQNEGSYIYKINFSAYKVENNYEICGSVNLIK